jgi:hypothetical protein
MLILILNNLPFSPAMVRVVSLKLNLRYLRKVDYSKFTSAKQEC